MVRRLVLAGSVGIVAALLFAVAMTAARWETADAITNCSTSSEGLDAAEIEVLTLINGHRAAAGVPALLAAPSLNRAAAWKSADSSNTVANLSHTDSLGRGPYQRAQDCGYPTGAGENIAAGYPSAASVVQGWMASPGHRANILNGFYTVIGVGHTGSSWVTDFGSVVEPGSFPVSGGASAPPPPSTPTPTISASNPNPIGGATQAPVAGGSTAPSTSESSGSSPSGARTVLPAKPRNDWELPWNVPVKRATMPLIASE